MDKGTSIAVVIPCYKVERQILAVIEEVGPEVASVYVVDDACPNGSGALVESRCSDARVKVLYHEENRGVGGATMTGYAAAVADGADIVVKLDGDGQMDPSFIPCLVRPIVEGTADYTKGNRFYDLSDLERMPAIRIFGNACLSFICKLSSGYWNIFDPTNGFTAIHGLVLKQMPLQKIAARYFFESDMLFRLNTLRAVVIDIPMKARYADEKSNLRVARVIPEFLFKNGRNFLKRLFYNYYLRDFSVASLEIVFGSVLFLFGALFGLRNWYEGHLAGVPVSSGTVMLSALPIILGMQFLLGFVGYDVQNVPGVPLHRRLK